MTFWILSLREETITAGWRASAATEPFRCASTKSIKEKHVPRAFHRSPTMRVVAWDNDCSLPSHSVETAAFGLHSRRTQLMRGRLLLGHQLLLNEQCQINSLWPATSCIHFYFIYLFIYFFATQGKKKKKKDLGCMFNKTLLWQINAASLTEQ